MRKGWENERLRGNLITSKNMNGSIIRNGNQLFSGSADTRIKEIVLNRSKG